MDASWLSEITPGTLLPTPPDLYCSPGVATFFGVWAGGFAFLVLPWVLWAWLKRGNVNPLIVWFGGFICSLLEPMLDHLGHLWWPRNLAGPAFSGFDLNIPYLIPPCYTFFIAMTGYFAYFVMAKGTSVKGIFLMWLAISMTDVILEIPGTSLGAYVYYGYSPFKVLGFPLWWGWINGTSMFMVGFLLYLVIPHLQGRRKALLLLAPITAMGASYGMTAWPIFMAINWKMPVVVAQLLTLFSLGLSIVFVRAVAAVVAKNAAAESSAGARVIAGTLQMS